MTPRKLCTQIINFLDGLQAAEIAVYVRETVICQGGEGVARVTWASGPEPMPGEHFLDVFDSVESYVNWLISQEFSAVLLDG
jgi:hypothetical protein